MNANRYRALFLVALAVCLLGCGLAELAAPTPTPEPTATPTATLTLTATATATVTATATPNLSDLYLLPPTQFFVNLLGEEFGPDVSALPGLGVEADVRIYLAFMHEDEIQIAVFGHVRGEWALLEIKPMETPTPTATPKVGRKARSG